MSSARPHVLYVAWGFPPGRGPGVYRALATANGLVRSGFDVTVLTADRETFISQTGVDGSLESRIDESIDIVRVPFVWPSRADWNIRHWGFRRGWNFRKWRDQQKADEVADFPELTYGTWFRPLIAAAEQVHLRRPVDLVVATANPNVDFAAADHLFRSAGVPYVMDYRDAWTLDLYNGEELHIDDPEVAAWEARLIENAREIWFVNDPIRQWYRSRYPSAADRMLVVENGHDPDFAPRPHTVARNTETPVNFGYIGTITNRVPFPSFVEGWNLARSRGGPMAAATADIYGYLGRGASPDKDFTAVLGRTSESGLSYHGPLDKEKVRDAYGSFDALLLILSAGHYVTSGKVYEYAASALPIVSVHDPGNAATAVLKDYPLWFPVTDLDAESIADALSAAAEAAQTADAEVRARCAAFAEGHTRDVQFAPRYAAMAEAFDAPQEEVRG